jgi:hypothetical protein
MQSHQEAFLKRQAKRCFQLADSVQEQETSHELRKIGEAFLNRVAEINRGNDPQPPPER